MCVCVMTWHADTSALDRRCSWLVLPKSVGPVHFSSCVCVCEMSRALHWCFTVNNPTGSVESGAPEYDYLVYGREVGESGTPHFQGYVCLKSRSRLTALKKWLPTAHFEVMRGTPQQASDYCKKDGDFIEHGTLPEPQCKAGGDKRKAQFQEAYELAKQGKREDIDPEFLIKYDGALRRIEAEHRECPPTLADQFSAIWIHGPPGSGKSRYVRDTYPSLYVKNTNKWFDGYTNEDYVLIEDVDPDTMAKSAHFYKIWLDRYPFRAEVKGGSMMIRPKAVICTSNYTIDECFEVARDAEAIRRRCRVISFP